MASIPPHVAARNCAVVGCSMAGSDTVSQHFERVGRGADDASWDRLRSLRMGVVGLCLSGPVSQLQHVCLERAFPGVSTAAVLAKVCPRHVLTSPPHLASSPHRPGTFASFERRPPR
jgi:hypothetical protein